MGITGQRTKEDGMRTVLGLKETIIGGFKTSWDIATLPLNQEHRKKSFALVFGGIFAYSAAAHEFELPTPTDGYKALKHETCELIAPEKGTDFYNYCDNNRFTTMEELLQHQKIG